MHPGTADFDVPVPGGGQPGPPADPVPRLHDVDGQALPAEFAGGGESGETGPHHDDVVDFVFHRCRLGVHEEFDGGARTAHRVRAPLLKEAAPPGSQIVGVPALHFDPQVSFDDGDGLIGVDHQVKRLGRLPA